MIKYALGIGDVEKVCRDGQMDEFKCAHMPDWTEGFRYLIPMYYTWDQWLLSTFH